MAPGAFREASDVTKHLSRGIACRWYFANAAGKPTHERTIGQYLKKQANSAKSRLVITTFR
jgi:hypothetical protein